MLVCMVMIQAYIKTVTQQDVIWPWGTAGLPLASCFAVHFLVFEAVGEGAVRSQITGW